MARKRMIDPDFWIDEKLGQCTRDERLLFMGLISNADDEGKGRANPKLIKSAVFPYDDDISAESVGKMMGELAEKGIAMIYEADGQEFYWLPNFLKHQKINRPAPSKIPDCENSSKFNEDSSKSNEDSQKIDEDSLRTHAQGKGKERKGKEERGKEYPRTCGEFLNLIFSDEESEKIHSTYEQPKKLIDKISRIVKNASKDYNSHYALLIKVADEDNWPKKRRPPDEQPMDPIKVVPMPDEVRAMMGSILKGVT